MDELARLRRYRRGPAGLEAAREQAARDLSASIEGRTRSAPKTRGRLIALAASISVVAAAGVSYAAVSLLSPPTRTLVGLTTAPVTGTGGGASDFFDAVPGLVPFDPLVRSPGPVPTVAQCRAAWNTHAPRPTRRWLAGYASRPAFVRVDTIVGNPAVGGPSTSYCNVQVLLGAGRELAARSLYERVEVPLWTGSIHPVPAEVEVILLSRFDASVAPDGTIQPG